MKKIKTVFVAVLFVLAIVSSVNTIQAQAWQVRCFGPGTAMHDALCDGQGGGCCISWSDADPSSSDLHLEGCCANS